MPRGRPSPAVRGYLMRGVVSAGSLVVAVLAVLGLAALAAPLPEETPLPADRVAAVPAALPAVEIAPESGVFDYTSRYTPGLTEYHAPARVSAPA